jgi:hypothetical protein
MLDSITTNLILKITIMEKMQKEKKRKTQSGEDLIDGLPVLRGMFVCPESLIDNLLPPLSDLVLSEQKVYEHTHSLHDLSLTTVAS